MKTVNDLIEKLRELAEALEERVAFGDLDGTTGLDIHTNTYGPGHNFLATYDGFIDLDNPTE